MDVDVGTTTKLTVELGTTGATGPTMAAVSTTLTGTGNNVHPRVWVVMPSVLLTASGVAGPLIPQVDVANTPLDAWREICDYDRWDTDEFLVNSAASQIGR